MFDPIKRNLAKKPEVWQAFHLTKLSMATRYHPGENLQLPPAPHVRKIRWMPERSRWSFLGGKVGNVWWQIAFWGKPWVVFFTFLVKHSSRWFLWRFARNIYAISYFVFFLALFSRTNSSCMPACHLLIYSRFSSFEMQGIKLAHVSHYSYGVFANYNAPTKFSWNGAMWS